MVDTRFKTGARPSPKHKLLAAKPHRVLHAPPAQFAIIPQQLNMWGNDQYGDCVSAEEAFAKACYSPELFVPASTVTAWASKNGFLNGADLSEVMDAMKLNGFQFQGTVSGTTYSGTLDDGSYSGVDFSNETVLQSAIAQGPVKVGMASSALPSGAGNQQGWYAIGPGPGGAEDHCCALCGYGPAGWLYQQLNVPLPSAVSATLAGYLFYTWSTIGFVDHAWIMGTVGEAWVRNPTTVGVPALPGPTPPPSPTNDVVTIATVLPKGTYPVGSGQLVLPSDLAIGSYTLTPPGPTPVVFPPAEAADLVKLFSALSQPTPPPIPTITKQERDDAVAYLNSMPVRPGH